MDVSNWNAIAAILRGDLSLACGLLRRGAPVSPELGKLIADRLEGKLKFRAGIKANKRNARWSPRYALMVREWRNKELGRLEADALASKKAWDRRAAWDQLAQRSHGISGQALDNKISKELVGLDPDLRREWES